MLKGKGIITDFQKELLIFLSKLPDMERFYLTGGTALAEFYFGHRRSYDLDIFTTEKGLLLPFSRLAEENLKNANFNVEVIRRFESFTEFVVSKEDEVRIQFAYDSPFRLAPVEDSNIGIKVNDYKDIIIDKLLAFFRRAEPRDTVDLFLILENENFWVLSGLAIKKDPGFDLYWMAVNLNKIKDFPDDITRWPVETIKEIDVIKLKNLFASLTREIMDRLREKKL